MAGVVELGDIRQSAGVGAAGVGAAFGDAGFDPAFRVDQRVGAEPLRAQVRLAQAAGPGTERLRGQRVAGHRVAPEQQLVDGVVGEMLGVVAVGMVPQAMQKILECTSTDTWSKHTCQTTYS